MWSLYVFWMIKLSEASSPITIRLKSLERFIGDSVSAGTAQSLVMEAIEKSPGLCTKLLACPNLELLVVADGGSNAQLAT